MSRLRVRSLSALVIALLATPVGGPRSAAAQGATMSPIATSAGPVVGRDSAGVRRWFGIPFAAAPVGTLRWRPPQPVAAWKEPRAAAQFGPQCMQTDRLTKLFGGPMDAISEDCLTLNVWSGARAGERRPVMVWIHGGAFTHGSGRSTVYDGTRLAELGAVVVTINYRLGIFGFLAHPALSAESPVHASGNYGLLDQAAALRWVQTEISAFGGDPSNVTIFGESAGAFSVGYLLVSAPSQGLFHKAILESGSAFRIVSPLRGGPSSAESRGLAIAERLGANGASSDALAQLRAIPSDSLLARVGESPLMATNETVDGLFLTEQPIVALDAGRVARVPIVIGSNADESTILIRDLKLRTAAELDSAARVSYPAHADRILAGYPAEGPVGPVKAFRLLWTDDVFTAPARETARAAARLGAPVFRYYYTRVASGMGGAALGAFHASEIPFVFGARGVTSPLWGTTSYDGVLADAMSGAWVRFASTGDPNGGALPAWPRFTIDGDEAFEFGPALRAIPGPRPSQLDLIAAALRLRLVGANRTNAGGSR